MKKKKKIEKDRRSKRRGRHITQKNKENINTYISNHRYQICEMKIL